MLIFKQPDFFSKEECQRMIELYHENNHKVTRSSKANTGGSMVEFSGSLGELKPAVVKCTKAMRVFNETMGFELADCLKAEIGILRYEKGGRVGMHIDTIGLCARKAVMMVMLSDNTFEGGDFVIDTGMENMPIDTRFKLACGEMLCFPSYYPHCLEEVTAGERYILVVGFHGDRPFR